MRHVSMLLLVPALLFSNAPAAAQQSRDLWTEYDGPRRIEFAVNGGLFLSSNWSDLVVLQSFGATGQQWRQVLLREFSQGPEFGLGGAVTYWRGRHGFRVQGGFVRSCVTTLSRCGDTAPAEQAFAPVEIDMDTWYYGVQGIVGLIEHAPGQWFRPYLIVGGGGVTYDLAEPLSSVVPGPLVGTGPTVISSNGRSIVVVDDPTTLLLATDEVNLATRFALNLGVGTDLRMPIGPGGLGLRVELSDHITESPLRLRIAQLDGGLFGHGIDEVRLDHRTVHNWRLTASLFLEFGLGGPAAPGTGF